MRPSPFLTTLIQSTLLNALSNILAQIIDQYKKDKQSFTLNTPAFIQFVIHAILVVPPNVAWQRWLEGTYPGFLFPLRSTPTTITTSATEGHGPGLGAGNGVIPGELKLKIDDVSVNVEEIPAPARRRRRGKVYNFLMKFVLDQTVGSVMNIVLFIVLINLLKGVGWEGSWGAVLEDFPPIMSARLKYRPLVSGLLYTVVPVERRVVFGSACGVVWGVYLSLYAAV